jgi:hypothetical protein
VRTERDPGYDRRLLMLAAAAGMSSIVALPLSANPTTAGLAVPLVFSLPLTLAVVGRMRGLPWMTWTAFVLLVLLGSVLILRIEPLAFLGVGALLLGPLVAVVAVGMPLRETDMVAAAGFLIGGTIAVVVGFATVDLAGSPGLVLGMALVGVTIVVFRLGRREGA